MKTITKKTAKNGATLYYIDGKRASRDKAIEISKNADNEMLTNALGANVELKDAQAILVISTEAPLEVGKDREFGWCFTNVVDAVEAAKKVATLFGDRFIRAYIMGDAEHFDNRIIATVDKAGNVEIKKQTPTYIFTDYQIIRGINPDGRTEHTETFATYCRELGDDDNFTGLYRAVTYYEEDDSSGWDIKTADGKIIAKGNTKAELQEAFENIKTGNVEVSEEIAEINAADVKINVADNGKIIEQIKVDVDTAISIINRLNYRNDTFIYCNTTREDNADIKYRHFDAYRDTGEKDGLALTEILINGKLEIVRFFNLFRDITVDLQIGNVNYTIGDKGAIVLTADNTPPDNEPMSDDISDICKYNPDLEDDNKPCRLDWDDSATFIDERTGEEELAEFNALPEIPAGTLEPVIYDGGKMYTKEEFLAKLAAEKSADKPAKFEIGKTYYDRSACDYETILTFKVIKRTAKTVTLEDKHGKTIKRKIYDDEQGEYCLPHGNYSMAICVSATADYATITDEIPVATSEDVINEDEAKAKLDALIDRINNTDPREYTYPVTINTPTFKTTTDKNGKKLYYIDGKRVGKDDYIYQAGRRQELIDELPHGLVWLNYYEPIFEDATTLESVSGLEGDEHINAKVAERYVKIEGATAQSVEETACDLTAKLKEVTRKARLIEIYPQVGGRIVDNLHKVEIVPDGGGFIFTNVYETLARYDTKEQCEFVIDWVKKTVADVGNEFEFPTAELVALEMHAYELLLRYLKANYRYIGKHYWQMRIGDKWRNAPRRFMAADLKYYGLTPAQLKEAYHAAD